MIAIIKSAGNNLTSVKYALQRLEYDAIISDDPAIIQAADHVILPGASHALATMQKLQALQLDRLIPTLTQPVLGICLGMQLLYDYSAEGDTKCLSIIPGQITRLAPSQVARVPHMGWNTVQAVGDDSVLLQGISQHSAFYFVHSFAAAVTEHTLASSEHGQTFTALVQYRNFYGTQFHPERSGAVGAQLLKNFLELRS